MQTNDPVYQNAQADAFLLAQREENARASAEAQALAAQQAAQQAQLQQQ